MAQLRALPWRRAQWVLVPLAIFVSTRLIGGWFLVLGAAQQVPLLETSPAYTVKFPMAEAPGYLGVATNWDAQWYRSIAEDGYPASLPREDGQVIQNEWAFFPVYPLLARAVMFLMRWDFALAGTVVSLVAAAAGCLILYRMLLRTGGRPTAMAAIVGLCTFPTAPTFQVAYSEGVALLLLAASLDALTGRRYGRLVPLMILLSLTRPIVLPFAVVIAVHGLVRWRRQRVDPFPARDRYVLVAGALVAAGSMGIWPITAAIVTGQADAYTRTQSAWGANQGAQGLWGNWFVAAFNSENSVALLVLLATVVVVLLLLALRPAAQRHGTELRTWAIAYTLYLFLATRPTPSMLRYLMLGVVPTWPIPSTNERPILPALQWALLGAVALAGLIAQYYWVTRVFTVSVAPESQMYP